MSRATRIITGSFDHNVRDAESFKQPTARVKHNKQLTAGLGITNI